MQKDINDSITIIQITDLHILSESGLKMSGLDTESSFIQVLAYAHTHHKQIDFILVTGDLAQNPCTSSYQRISKELEKYQVRTICLPGNHDDLALMKQFINTEQVNCNKHIRFNHWQIICLNSKKEGAQGGYLAAEEFNYLEKTLDKNPNINTLLAVHPPSPSYAEYMDGFNDDRK